MNRILNTEELLVLSACKMHPDTADRERIAALLPEVKNWKLLTDLLSERGLAPLFLHRTLLPEQQKGLPTEVRWVLQQLHFKTLTRNMILYNAFTQLATIFRSAGIRLIALKGIGLAETLYQDIQLRQMSDIDILVHPEDGLRCIELLKTSGYVPAKSGALSDFVASVSDFVHYTPMIQNGVSVEVHVQLHYREEPIQINMDRFWQDAVPAVVGGVAVWMPDLHHQLIHLAVHLHKHFQKGHVQFSSFADLVNILQEHQHAIDWNKMENLCADYCCVREVFSYLLLVSRYCYAPFPAGLYDRYSAYLTDELCEQFFRYLHGYQKEEAPASAVPAHLQNIRHLKGIRAHVHYFRDLFFPSPSFMQEKYGQIRMFKKRKNFAWWLCYPYRWWTGVRGLWNSLR